MDEPIWTPGRALVYAEDGEVEYYMAFEDDEGVRYFLTACGARRPARHCRPLEYVANVNRIDTKHYRARKRSR